MNNQTLNETLKLKIEEEKEANKRDDMTVHTYQSRENRSLDKSGIDYLTEARDFQNIIGNLKSLLHKGKTSMSNNKSFMTLDQ